MAETTELVTPISFLEGYDLASERLGGAVLCANDEFFAPKENLLKAETPVFLEHEYTDRGKWMDGWETRRRRTPGFDWCIVRLGLPGIIRGVIVNTAFFRGNYPESCSIEACATRPDAMLDELTGPQTRWTEILPRSPLRGDSQNAFPILFPHRVTHVRLNIFPDGGVARLRLHGDIIPDWKQLGRRGAEFDVAAAENGAYVLSCSDMFFGVRHNLIMPGRAKNMGDGWETKRRRGPGHDWALLSLAAQSDIRRIEVDTNHFKGNYPDACMIEGINAPDTPLAELSMAYDFVEILPRTKLQAHTRHFFEEQLTASGPFTHLRLNIYPDGGVSRLRVIGAVTREGAIKQRIRRLNALLRDEVMRELLHACGSTAWATAMADARPFETLEGMVDKADRIWAGLSPKDWLEAFRAHPRIGESKAQTDHGLTAKRWSTEEQKGVQSASDETMNALAEVNLAYEQKFGYLFIVCATGKSADEMLAIGKQRLANDPETELPIAADEQRKITRIRLTKMVSA